MAKRLLSRGAALLRDMPMLNRAAVARELRVSRQVVSAWARGVSRPGEEKAKQLKRLLKIPVSAWSQPSD